jgi:hypothetical protein
LQQQILDALGTVPDGTEIVATEAYHDRHAFLGLVPYNLGAFTRVRGLTVMRVDDTGGTYGSCDTFPIAMSLNNWSLYPSDYAGTLPTNHELFPDDWGNGQAAYWPGDRDGASPPSYTTTDSSQFPHNVPGHHVTDANIGDIFLTRQVEENRPSSFGWLRWNSNTSSGNTPTLAQSLTWPGNSTEYCYNEAACNNDPGEPAWSADGRINRFDRLRTSTGNSNANGVLAQMEEHVDMGALTPGRLLRLIVFTPPDWVEETGYGAGDANNDGWRTDIDTSGGSGATYEVYAFVLARILGYDFTGSDKWLLMEFNGWDVECGPAPAYP